MARYDRPEFSRQVRDSRYFFLNQHRVKDHRLVVVCGGRETCAPDYAIDRRTFPYFGVEWVERGQGEVWLGGRHHLLLPATVFCYGPGVACRIRTDPEHPLTKCFVDLTGEEAATLLGNARIAPGRCVRLAKPVVLAELFDDLLRDASRHGPEIHEIAAAYCRLLLLKIKAGRVPATSGASSGARLESFLRCRQYLFDHFHEHPTVESAARELGLTPSYLCRLFREQGEASPYQMLLRLRMNQALDRLLHSGGQVKQTSFASGFRDPAHFSRVFRRVHGVSPSELLARTQMTRRRRN